MFCQHHISCLLWKCTLEESFRKSDPILAGFKRNYSTPCIHGIQQGQMVMWRVVINLPPPCRKPPPPKTSLLGSRRASMEARKAQTSWDVQQTSQWLQQSGGTPHYPPQQQMCFLPFHLSSRRWRRSSEKEISLCTVGTNERFVQKGTIIGKSYTRCNVCSSLAWDIHSCLLSSDVSSSVACFCTSEFNFIH